MEHKEKILKNSIKPISLPKQEEITRRMKKCVCKIHFSGGNGTGFFAQIPFNNTKIKVLITSNHVLNAEDIKDKKIITFTINKEIKDIEMDKERKRYTSEKYDTTIIEIKERDEFKDSIQFLEIDDINLKSIKEKLEQKSNEYFSNLYKNESLYVLNHLGGNDIVISYGFFIKIEDFKIHHKCSTDDGSSGAPILSLENNKLIGVHYGSKKNNFEINLGSLIAYPILEFQDIKIAKDIMPIPMSQEIKPKKLYLITIRYRIYEKDSK